MKARLHGLDFLRAIMMSLGVVLHSAQLYLTLPIVDYYWDSARSFSMDALLIFINTFRMPVFYLLSGFFTALLLARHGERAMLNNRYRRLVVPFLLYLPPLALVMTILKVVARHVMATGEIGFDPGWMEYPRGIWDNTHNLWFLYYLILYVGTLWLLVRLWAYLPDSARTRLGDWARNTPVYSAWIFLPLCLSLAALGSISYAGRLAGSLSFVPYIPTYLYFALCFSVGWLLYQRLGDLDVLALRWGRHMLLATLALGLGVAAFFSKGTPGHPNYAALHALLSVATGFSMGFYMLGFVGLFSRYFQDNNPWIRYFSDSAYWVFIFHSVPLVILGLALHAWEVPAELKFLVVCAGTSVTCLVTYQLFVRNGRIGEVLNGRRYRSVPWSSN
ncbi:MAG: acyltransferase family protein [Pseudomonadota bacterium]